VLVLVHSVLIQLVLGISVPGRVYFLVLQAEPPVILVDNYILIL
jgi:hypothetical protein